MGATASYPAAASRAAASVDACPPSAHIWGGREGRLPLGQEGRHPYSKHHGAPCQLSCTVALCCTGASEAGGSTGHVAPLTLVSSSNSCRPQAIQLTTMMRAALLGSLAATCATKVPPSCPDANGTPTVRRGGLVMRPASYSAAGLHVRRALGIG